MEKLAPAEFAKAKREKLLVELPERYFDDTIDITVTCSMTGKRLTRHNVPLRDIDSTRKALRIALSAEALADESNLDLLDAQHSIDYKKEYKAKQAAIRMTPRGPDMSLSYDDDSRDDIPMSAIPRVSE